MGTALPLGPFELSELSVEGVVLTLTFLLALATSLGVSRLQGVPARLVLEAYILAVPAAAIAGRAGALVTRWPQLSRDPAVLTDIVLSPPRALPATAAVALVAAALAWAAHGAWRRFLDAVAPGATLVSAALLALPFLRRAGSASDGTAAAVAALGAVVALLLARCGAAPLVPALVAGEALALAHLVRLAWNVSPTAFFVSGRPEVTALGAVIIALLLGHLALVRRQARVTVGSSAAPRG